MTNKRITFDDLHISIGDVLRDMGYDNIANADAAIVAELEAMMADISRWLKPRLAFTVNRGCLDTQGNTLTVNDTTFSCGRIVARQLRGSEAYALFVCSAGVEYQEFMDRLTAEGDMVRLFNAHTIGSLIAERCADNMEVVLQSTIDKLSWQRTNRFSPGYCGWHVREQQLLFPLLAGHATGVELTPSSLMMPIKSVSGVIGLGPSVRYLDYTCGLCDYKDCYKRRTRKEKVEK